MECFCKDLGLRENMSWDELLIEIVRPENYCTSLKHQSPGWICPTLDKELRRADAERSRVEGYYKRKKAKNLQKGVVTTAAPRVKSEVPANFKPRSVTRGKK